MGGDDPDRPKKPRPKFFVLAGRVLYWIGCAAALAMVLNGIYLAGQGLFILMPAHRPTGASLTMAAGVVWAGGGALVYVIGRGLLRVFGGE